MTQSSLPSITTEPVLVSVVLPAYNHEAYIAQAIDSALAQSVDLELIVIDDGSRDRTADIIAAYDDPRIRFVRQANAGSHATINRGIAMARGRYVAILNSDDRFHPERLARLVALARSRAGPTFANGITKSMLHHEWAMDIDQAIEAEAQAQALCMLTEDFGRAYRAFAAKHKPVFEGN